jgi:transposase-like protein
MRKKRGPTAYTEEFRRNAVRLVEAQPEELNQIARDLDVHPETLRSWWRRVQHESRGKRRLARREEEGTAVGRRCRPRRHRRVRRNNCGVTVCSTISSS